MKKVFIGLTALVMFTGAVHASEAVMPKECLEVVSSEFSTGNGDSAFLQLEVMCKTGENTWKIYVQNQTSASGFFGFGRATKPEDITITIGNHSGEMKWN